MTDNNKTIARTNPNMVQVADLYGAGGTGSPALAMEMGAVERCLGAGDGVRWFLPSGKVALYNLLLADRQQERYEARRSIAIEIGRILAEAGMDCNPNIDIRDNVIRVSAFADWRSLVRLDRGESLEQDLIRNIRPEYKR